MERVTETRVRAFISIVMKQDKSCTKWTDSEATDPIKEIKVQRKMTQRIPDDRHRKAEQSIDVQKLLL